MKTFETALAELEQMVKKLEAGDTTLEEAMTLFEKGVALTMECGKILADANLKVQKLVGEKPEDVGAE